ncbi:hypothetical protein GRF59_14980 [Paenibacillus sp. HJL G12]|uniref:Uncharacterized protein n=1 Tax=Paenibacillus dendrobii TaxID=2691084 RepID=A0A7X3IJ43_9BACL|nr:hypothetical protein [Paenibacillus dendrobii]MWV44924.1 hypothetical protein [Paenibacillus dendrobii]
MSEINNNKVQVSIVNIQGDDYILYLHTVGLYKCMLEQIESRERAISKQYDNPVDAVTDAYEQLFFREQSKN